MSTRSSDPFSRHFAASLRKARKKKQLSHETLAQLSGVARSTISNIESCRKSPTLYICHKIAAALGIKLSELIRDAE